MTTIYELVRRMERDYTSGTPSQTSKYVEFNQYENINKIDAYANSKHITGETDSMDREKPFFDIVTAAINIWYRATDIDRKNIKIKATKASNYIASFIATIWLQDWMRKSMFGQFLNNWGRTLAKYGSAVIKFVEKDGELYKEVVSWNKLICDPINFDANPKIEKLQLTPAQLREKEGYDQDMVEKLIDAVTTRELLSGEKVDNISNFIDIYEIHGNLPLSYLTGKEKDEKVYRQQMHVVSFVEGKEKNEFDNFTLVSGKEAKDPYMITHLIEEDGRTQAKGAVEHLFEAQWMMNHTVKQIKDQLDLTSKLIFQTSDGNFVGRNALTAIENGDILVHAINQPLTQVNNNSSDITALQNFGNQWKVLSQEIVSTPDSLMGKTAPSGTAWRQVEAVQSEANSLFELMTENKGLAIEEMCRRFILPFAKKQLNSKEEISAILSDYQVTQLDAMFLPAKINKVLGRKLVEKVLSDEEITPETIGLEQEELKQEAQETLGKMGNQRFISPDDIDQATWKEVFKDIEWEADVDVTGENRDSQNVITTLTTVLQTIGNNPTVLTDPNMKMLFNKIITETGAFSPIELSTSQTSPQPTVGGQVGGEMAMQPQA